MKFLNHEIGQWPARCLDALMPRCLLLFLHLILTFPALSFAQIPCRYDVEIIQAPGCQFGIQRPTVALGISPNGKYVVGRYGQCDDPSNDEAFCYDTETKHFMTLPRPAGTTEALASDVNDDGWIIGTYALENVGSAFRGFVYKIHENEWIELSPPKGNGESFANAINIAGQVCGSRSAGKSRVPYTAFIWTESEGFNDLGLINGNRTTGIDINDYGAVTGTFVIDETNATFLWDKGEVTDIGSLASLSTIPRGINNNNHIVGGSRLPPPPKPSGTSHAYVWKDGIMTDLGVLPGKIPEHNRSFCFDVNDHGVGVGSSFTQGQSNSHEVFWWNGNVVDVQNRVVSGSEIKVEAIGTITNDAIITGTGIDEFNDIIAIVLTPTYVLYSDLDANCVINVDDLLQLIGAWGKLDSTADVDRNGIVNVYDLLFLLEEWKSQQ